MEHEGRAPPAGTKGLLGKDRCHAAIIHTADDAGARGVDRMLIHALHNAFRLYPVWSAEHSTRVGLLVAGFFDPDLFRSFKANLDAIDRIDGGHAAALPGGGSA